MGCAMMFVFWLGLVVGDGEGRQEGYKESPRIAECFDKGKQYQSIMDKNDIGQAAYAGALAYSCGGKV